MRLMSSAYREIIGGKFNSSKRNVIKQGFVWTQKPFVSSISLKYESQDGTALRGGGYIGRDGGSFLSTASVKLSRYYLCVLCTQNRI